ncbi:MAG TPA: 4'-phosphopantetheinyl transferase superfamily protein [Microvirga sp.]|nr:4'-phosphopantetheinyl transferase superfamily protein [Microvirga sp.]
MITSTQLDVWTWDLDHPPLDRQRLETALDQSELRRAERFRSAQGRNRFVAGRGYLRLILGRYTGIEPRSIEFTYGKWGKPALRPASNPGNVTFNLSHSENVAAVAVAKDAPTGIDVERVVPADVDLATPCLSEAERRAWESLTGREADVMFFERWTRKEAITKAIGVGLNLPLHQIEITGDLGRAPNGLRHGAASEQSSIWRLYPFEPTPGFVGAVASEATALQVRMISALP